MIDPRIAIEDVDPDCFAHLNGVLRRRDSRTKTTATIVHDGVAPDTLPDADEVVLLDRRGLDDLSAQLVELARQTDDQGELLARCRRAYLEHWAVQVVPPPPPSADAWAPVQALLNSVPDGHWIEVHAGDWVLAAEIEHGRIVRITSRPPGAAARAMRVVGSLDDLDAVLSAADVLGELRARANAGRVSIDVQGRVEWPA